MKHLFQQALHAAGLTPLTVDAVMPHSAVSDAILHVLAVVGHSLNRCHSQRVRCSTSCRWIWVLGRLLSLSAAIKWSKLSVMH